MPPSADCLYTKHIPQKDISEYILDGIEVGLAVAQVTSFPFINLIGPIAVSYFFESKHPWAAGLAVDFFVPLLGCTLISTVYGKIQHLQGNTRPKSEKE